MNAFSKLKKHVTTRHKYLNDSLEIIIDYYDAVCATCYLHQLKIYTSDVYIRKCDE